jgi:hypothetical protein
MELADSWKQLVAAEPGGVPMGTTKQQTSPWKPLDYISDRAGSNTSLPCGGGVEYLHRNPASRRRRRKGKSRI